MKKFIRLISIFLVAFALCTGCSEDTTVDIDPDISGDDNSSTATEFNVSFYSYGGTAVASQTVGKYDSALEPETPIKAGYTFEGWYEDADFTLEYDFVIPVVADLSLYAMWLEEVYTVTFYYQDEDKTTEETTVLFGESVETPNPPSRLNYEWEGWFTASEGGEEYTFEVIDEDCIPEDGTINLYSQWTEVPTVAIVYLYSAASYEDMDAVEPFNTQYIRDGGSLPTIVADAVENYNTDGIWYTNSDFTEEYDPSKVYEYDGSEVEEIHLYAKWDINTYTITFETNGGVEVATLEDVPYGTIFEDSADERFAVSYTGYTFDGWYVNQWFGISFVFGETEVTSDLTLYAKWNINTYNVVFDFDGGEYTASYLMDKGATQYETIAIFESSIDEPTSIYYDLEYIDRELTFLEEWYTAPVAIDNDDDYTEIDGYYDFAALSADDVENGLVDETGTITLYARWGVRVTIQFNSNIDYSSTYDIYSRQFLKNGESATEVSLADASISGYVNDGKWYSDPDCTTEYDFNTKYDNIEESYTVHLFSKWEVNAYDVTYDVVNSAAYSETIEPVTLTYGSTIDVLPIIGEEDSYFYNGLVFDGWYTDSEYTEGTEFVAGVTEVTSHLTLYAKWSKGGTISVTYVYNSDIYDDEVKEYTYNETYESFGSASPTYSTPTKDDATFIGWYVTAEEGEELTEVYDMSTPLTSNMSLTAKYWDHSAEEVTIVNLTEFLMFRDFTNQGIALTQNIKLAADIDLSTECGATVGDWTPIANSTVAAASNVYSGTFDGGDHTISNLYSGSTAGHNRSLFSHVLNATIKNLHMVDVYIVNSGTANYCSAIAGYIPTDGTLYMTNCSTTGGSITGTNQNGGLLGSCGLGTVVMDNCHNYGTAVTSGTNFVGGLVGRTYTTGSNTVPTKITNSSNSGTVNGAYAGGIVGELSCSAQIIGCVNTGTISKNALYQGGIAGITQYWTTNDTASIIACYNLGTISSTTTSNIGGILGGVYTKTGSTITITSCYNMGTISTTGTTGGIIGNTNGTVTLSSNYFIGSSYGVGGTTVDGATKLDDVTALSSVLSTMNAACVDYGYKFVEGTSNPTLEAL